MISLRPVAWEKIAPWAVDFQKKSKNFEMLPDEAELVGIYRGDVLIGYFATLCYDSGVVEIRQGYLRREDRHKNISRIAMELLEKQAVGKGFRKVVLGTNRAANSYINFMKRLGYHIQSVEFSKDLING